MTGDTSIPVEWSAIVGDALHNLRSALDCFVVGLAESNLARALTADEERRLQFPICATPNQWNDQVVKGHRLDNVRADAVEEIRRLQPFYVHELAGLTDNDRLEAAVRDVQPRTARPHCPTPTSTAASTSQQGMPSSTG